MAMWQSRQSWVVYGCGAHLAVWVDGDVAVPAVLGGVWLWRSPGGVGRWRCGSPDSPGWWCMAVALTWRCG